MVKNGVLKKPEFLPVTGERVTRDRAGGQLAVADCGRVSLIQGLGGNTTSLCVLRKVQPQEHIRCLALLVREWVAGDCSGREGRRRTPAAP